MSNAITIAILPSNNLAIITKNDSARFILDQTERTKLDALLNQLNDLIEYHDTNAVPSNCPELY